MKIVSAILLLALAICGCGGSEDTLPALTEADIVPGTRVAMRAPEGFEPSDWVPGFVGEAGVIKIVELPTPLDELIRRFDGQEVGTDEFETTRPEPMSKSEVTVPGGKAVLFHHKHLKIGVPSETWTLVQGNRDRCVVITATSPRSPEHSVSAEFKQALLGARWFPDRAIDSFASLPFTLTQSEALPLALRFGNRLVFSEGGRMPDGPEQPRFVVQFFPYPEPDSAERGREARSTAKRAARGEGIRKFEIRSCGVVAMDEVIGYEVEAVGQHEETKARISIYLLMVFDEESFAVMYGSVGGSSEREFPKLFRTMARSYRRKGGRASDPSDGALTDAAWTALHVPTNEPILGGQFIDATTGFLVGGGRRGESDALLLATRDGGESWRRVATGFKGSLSDVHFPTAKIGYVVGSGNTILKTTDGGATFARLSVKSHEPLETVHFVSPEVGFVAGGWKLQLIFRVTRDGGFTWTSAIERLPEAARRAAFHQIVFLDPRVGLVVGYGGLILRTRDGGDSWRLLSSGTDEHLRALAFVDARVGFIGGSNGVLLRTEDGGVTWTRQSGHPNEDIMGLHFLDADHGFSTTPAGEFYNRGGGGRLFETRDGGRSWHELNFVKGELDVLAFAPGSAVGYAAGAKGIVLKRGPE